MPIGKAKTKQEAFKIGKHRVEHTARASFKVRELGSTQVVRGYQGMFSKLKFRESKKEPGVFIQRRKFRISTAGEKKDIPYKGLQVQKVKRIFGKRRR